MGFSGRNKKLVKNWKPSTLRKEAPKSCAALGCCGSLKGTSGVVIRQGLSAPSTHPQVEFSVFIARLDPEGVDGIGVDGGGLDLEDVRGHGSVRADAHVLVHHRVGQLTANGVGHRAHTAAATHTGGEHRDRH